MISVERQMETIRNTAVNLEQSFAPNRSKADNLVGSVPLRVHSFAQMIVRRMPIGGCTIARIVDNETF